MSTCGATNVAKATVPSKSSESKAIWVNAMVFLRLIIFKMVQIYCYFSNKTRSK